MSRCRSPGPRSLAPFARQNGPSRTSVDSSPRADLIVRFTEVSRGSSRPGSGLALYLLRRYMNTPLLGRALSLALLAATGCGDNLHPTSDAPTFDASRVDAPGDDVGDTLILTSNGRLVSFDRAAPTVQRTSVTLSGLGSETIVGFDRRPSDGGLYALTSAGKLYTVAPDTGVATLKSTLAADAADTTAPYTALSGTSFGVDFNPVPDRLRVTTDTGQNLRINVDTGATTTDGAVNGAATGYS
ncbi:MAG: DUF4394 domain-containing protein, partial [Deltaproteobacteria bacterium]|nr:DUF4394 domain-containing protein [Deltaproteobacteria bacterium]